MLFRSTALPDGLVGWWRQGGPQQLQAMLGGAPPALTYPELDLDPAVQAEKRALQTRPGRGDVEPDSSGGEP